MVLRPTILRYRGKLRQVEKDKVLSLKAKTKSISDI